MAQVIFVSQIGLVECESFVQTGLQPAVQGTFSCQNTVGHKEVEAARYFGTDVGVCQAADFMDRLHCIALGEFAAPEHLAAVDAGGKDPHQASVSIIPVALAAALLGISGSSVAVDRLHCAVSDVIRITVRSELAVIHPLHEILHDVIEIDPLHAADALQKRESKAAVVCPGPFRKIKGSVTAHPCDRIAGDFFA